MAALEILNPPNAVDGGPATAIVMPVQWVKGGKTLRSQVVCPGMTIWDHLFAQALHGASNLAYAEWLQHRVEATRARGEGNKEATEKASDAACADAILAVAFAEQVADRAMEVRFEHIRRELPQEAAPDKDNGSPRIIRPDFKGDE